MADVASIYLPAGAAIFVTLGAIAAIMTALNGTIFVPSRLAIMFVKDGLAPRWLGFINKATATPIRGLTLTHDLLRDFIHQRTACTRFERCSLCPRRALFHS